MPERIGSSQGYMNRFVVVHSTREHILHASKEEVADGASEPIVVGDFVEGLLAIDVTETEGDTASTAFKLQTKVNGLWKDIPDVTIAAVTGAISILNKVTNFGEEIRLTWDLGADTTSITFSASFLAKS